MKRDLGSTHSPIPFVSDEDIDAQEFHLDQREFTAQGHNRKLCNCSLLRACFSLDHVLGTASILSFVLGNNVYERDRFTLCMDE